MLSIEHEIHNLHNIFERELRDWKYQSDLAFAEFKKRHEQYVFMKPHIDKMSIEEKLEWLGKWIDYLVDWHIKDKNEFEKQYGYMNFEVFIATETIPYKWFGLDIVLKPRLIQIEYR